jgi:hypothetical protein
MMQANYTLLQLTMLCTVCSLTGCMIGFIGSTIAYRAYLKTKNIKEGE